MKSDNTVLIKEGSLAICLPVEGYESEWKELMVMHRLHVEGDKEKVSKDDFASALFSVDRSVHVICDHAGLFFEIKSGEAWVTFSIHNEVAVTHIFRDVEEKISDLAGASVSLNLTPDAAEVRDAEDTSDESDESDESEASDGSTPRGLGSYCVLA